MAPHYLLDTNICIYIRQKRPLEVLARFRGMAPGDVGMSVITHGELVYGAERSERRDRSLQDLSELSDLIPVLPLPDGASVEYGRLRAKLEKRGTLIGNNDLWIAAHAKSAGLVLVTNNEKEFRRMEGLHVENWAARK
jgi:tRNA(fMet)-specific endonuclease VapC